MSVKVIERSEFYGQKPNNKRALFLADVKEIYEKRIEFSELEDFPYSKKTSMVDVERYARIFLAQQYFRLTGKRVKAYEDIPFSMSKVRDENDNIHIYCAFHLSAWDRMIEATTEGEKK